MDRALTRAMHLPDAFVSPAAGLAFDAVALAFAVAAAIRTARNGELERRLPLMAGLGALVFALQMIRFPLPDSGASAQLGGGLLVAVLLGPDAALLVVLSVLFVQAVVFAQGGLLALGPNFFAAAVFPAWLGLPLYRRVAGSKPSFARSALAAVAAALFAFEAGAISVGLLAAAADPDVAVGRFVGLLAGLHVPIGVAEGVATAGLLAIARRILPSGDRDDASRGTATLAVLGAALFAATVLADFSSERPEWPEWVKGQVEHHEGSPDLPDRIREAQLGFALLPGYDVPEPRRGVAWPSNAATSVAGLFGALSTALVVLAGGLLTLPLERSLRPRSGAAPEA